MGRGSVRRAPVLKVVRPADEVAAVVGAVVPEDLVRAAAPSQAAALLPVPGRGLADLRPLVVVLQVDVANLSAVGGRHVAILKIDLHGQRVPARLIELQAVEEPEARVGGPVLRPGIRHADDGRVAQVLAFDDFLPASCTSSIPARPCPRRPGGAGSRRRPRHRCRRRFQWRGSPGPWPMCRPRLRAARSSTTSNPTGQGSSILKPAWQFESPWEPPSADPQVSHILPRVAEHRDVRRVLYGMEQQVEAGRDSVVMC